MLWGLLQWKILLIMPTMTGQGTPRKPGSFHTYPQASRVSKKSFLGGEPEAHPLWPAFHLEVKWISKHQLPGGLAQAGLGMHCPSASRQAQPGDGSQVYGVGVGGAVLKPQNQEPECLWWIHKVGLQLRALSTFLKHRPGEKVKDFGACPSQAEVRHHEINNITVVLTPPQV